MAASVETAMEHTFGKGFTIVRLRVVLVEDVRGDIGSRTVGRHVGG